MSKLHICDGDCNSCFSNKNDIIAGSGYAVKKILDESKSNHIYKKGELIFKQGLYPQGFFCLSKGKVMVTQTDDFGNEFIVHLYKEVEFLGLASFFSNKPYESNCIAIEDCHLCFFTRATIENLLLNQKEFAGELLTAISNQFINANKRTLDLTKKNMRARIADALLEMYNVFGLNGQGELDGYLKRSEIGMFACVSEANVIRALSEFQKENIISIQGKKIVLKDIKGLQRISVH